MVYFESFSFRNILGKFPSMVCPDPFYSREIKLSIQLVFNFWIFQFFFFFFWSPAAIRFKLDLHSKQKKREATIKHLKLQFFWELEIGIFFCLFAHSTKDKSQLKTHLRQLKPRRVHRNKMCAPEMRKSWCENYRNYFIVEICQRNCEQIIAFAYFFFPLSFTFLFSHLFFAKLTESTYIPERCVSSEHSRCTL